jgi:hypothetical protein
VKAEAHHKLPTPFLLGEPVRKHFRKPFGFFDRRDLEGLKRTLDLAFKALFFNLL